MGQFYFWNNYEELLNVNNNICSKNEPKTKKWNITFPDVDTREGVIKYF